jgi:hypothetical protein
MNKKKMEKQIQELCNSVEEMKVDLRHLFPHSHLPTEDRITALERRVSACEKAKQ